MVGMRGRLITAIAALAALAGAALPATAGAAKIVVTLTADEFGSGGFCSLREAVQAANADADFGGCTRAGTGTDDKILLEAGETYQRSLGGAEDLNAGGDLDFTGPTRIKVVGDGVATIDANDLDRVLEIHPLSRLEASDLVITDGTALVPHPSNRGGGINNLGRLELTDSTISYNEITSNTSCTCGGGLASSGRAKLLRVLVTQNRSEINFGGGIATIGGRVVITGSTIDQNFGGRGAGIGVAGNDGKVLIGRTTISNNEAVLDEGENGGGIYSAASGESETKVTNATISGNTVTGSGGGVYVFSGAVSLNGVTVTDNIADYEEEGVYTAGGLAGQVGFQNSIVAGNDSPVDLDNADCLNSAGLGHNLVGKGTGCFPGSGGKSTLAPLLGPLADNGGPNLTHKLLAGSPAIGLAGNSAPAKDQRGKRRDAHPDAGSYER